MHPLTHGNGPPTAWPRPFFMPHPAVATHPAQAR